MKRTCLIFMVSGEDIIYGLKAGTRPPTDLNVIRSYLPKGRTNSITSIPNGNDVSKEQE